MNENDINKAIFGSSMDWYKSINKSMQFANKFNNLFGLTDISKFVNQTSIYEKNIGLNSMLGISAIQNIQKSLKAINPAPNPLLPFSSQISQIIKQQEAISKRLTPLSNLGLSIALLQGINKIKQQSIPDFSTAFSGLVSFQQKSFENNLQKYLTNSIDFYARQQDYTRNLEVIIEDMQNITSVLLEIKDNQKITKEDIRLINNTLQKPDTSAFIYFIIQIILALLLSFYNSKPENGTNINITINNIEKKEIETGFNKTLELLCLEQRKAMINVNLRTKPNRNSGKIGLIQKGQIVLVQSINHKWIYVVYKDEDYLLKSGWVFKKYFERMKN